MNKKGMVNKVFRKGSQFPTSGAVQAMRLVSREMLFRLSMTFLHRNREVLRRKMIENSPQLDESVIENYSTKVTELLRGMYPPAGHTPKNQFFQLEKWVGHDNLVDVIMTYSKKRTGLLVFADNIPEAQWDKFVAAEEKKGKATPMADARFHTYTPTLEAPEVSKTKKKVKKVGKKETQSKLLGNRFTAMFLNEIDQVSYIHVNELLVLLRNCDREGECRTIKGGQRIHYGRYQYNQVDTEC